MSETTEQAAASLSRPPALGVYDQVEPEGPSRYEILAALATVIWLVAAAAYFFLVDGPEADKLTAIHRLAAFTAVILPVGLIWVTAAALRAAHAVQRESQRLQASVDAMRHAFVAQSQGQATGDDPSSVARKLDEIAAATRKTETVLATFTSRREQPRVAEAPEEEPLVLMEEQPALALEIAPEDAAPPLETDDFLRALNFPQTAEDEEGFAALRRAMQDRTAAQLIQAAQDALTLLSQDGIYMDDLIPDRARPEVWRQFGQGVRGRAIASLGGIRAEVPLSLTASRMKQDPIFRDTAHHFLRLFDKTFATFEAVATDAEVQALAETRTARAFMLLGRVAGTFD